MKRHEAIEAVARTFGNQDMVEAGASAERLVNALVRLGLLKFDDPGVVGGFAQDRTLGALREAARQIKDSSPLSDAAQCLDGMPVNCTDDGELTTGAGAMIILRLVAKGFRITRA